MFDFSPHEAFLAKTTLKVLLVAWIVLSALISLGLGVGGGIKPILFRFFTCMAPLYFATVAMIILNILNKTRADSTFSNNFLHALNAYFRGQSITFFWALLMVAPYLTLLFLLK